MPSIFLGKIVETAGVRNFSPVRARLSRMALSKVIGGEMGGIFPPGPGKVASFHFLYRIGKCCGVFHRCQPGVLGPRTSGSCSGSSGFSFLRVRWDLLPQKPFWVFLRCSGVPSAGKFPFFVSLFLGVSKTGQRPQKMKAFPLISSVNPPFRPAALATEF